MEGITEYDTKQGVHVCRLHYTADEDKRSEEWKATAKTGISDQDWEREYEINPNAPRGKAWYPEWKYDLHVAKEPLQPIPGRPIGRFWDYGLCYADDTEVLTLSGWKLFKDVDEDADLVATRNPDTGVMEYTKINFKVDKPFDGELLEWANSTINFCVTPEHRVPFTFRDSPDHVHWQSAEWLSQHMTGHHYVDLCARWTGKDRDVAIGDITMSAQIYADFIGVYLSEGSCCARRVTVYQKPGVKADAIRSILAATGIEWKEYFSDGMILWCVTSADLSAYLSGFGVQEARYVPEIIKQMTPDTIKRFINAYTLGDGSVRRRENGSVEHNIASSSKRMIDDFQELALKAGWHSSARFQEPTTSVIVEDGKPRTITNKGIWLVTFKKKAKRGELLVANFRKVKYSGRIYCLNVPYHTLFVRRNGKPSWNGNTPATAFAQTTAKGQLLILYPELQSEDCGITAHGAVVASESRTWFPGYQFNDIGDPAGNQRSQTDEKSCNDILREKYGINVMPGPVSFTERDEALRNLLKGLTPDGQPRLLIDPRCSHIIAAFRGGYQRKEVAGVYTEEPDKNMFSHIMDAIQYGAASIFGMGERKPFVNRKQGGYVDERTRLSAGYRRGYQTR